MVEFSSPNLGQEFTGDHLRSTIIGAFVASIYENMGWDVVRINFLGDWGKHIGLLAVGWTRFYSEDLFMEDPLRHVLSIYTKAEDLLKAEQEAIKEASTTDSPEVPRQTINEERDAFFKRMEDGEPDALAFWNQFQGPCVSRYTELYERIGLKFDEYSGESKFSPETAAEVDMLLKGYTMEREEDGAWSIDFESHGYKNLGSPKVRYPDGTTTYLFRDIAAVLERNRQYSFDKMIYVVTGKQDLHFHQLVGALTLVGHADLASKLQHVNFAKVQVLAPPDPGSGSGLLLGDVLDQCQRNFRTFLEIQHEDLPVTQGSELSQVAESLAGIGLLTQQGLAKRGANFNVDFDDMAVLNPYTGLLLQCWLSKIRFQKLKGLVIPREALVHADYSIFDQDEYEPFADVLRLLVQFPGMVKHSFKTLESSHILTLLFRVTDLLPDVWAADPDNREQQEGEGVEEAEEPAGPSNTVEVDTGDQAEATGQTNDHLREDIKEASPPEKLPEAEEIMEIDLEREADKHQPPEQSVQADGTQTTAHADDAIEITCSDDSPEAVADSENTEALRGEEPIVELSQQAGFPSPSMPDEAEIVGEESQPLGETQSPGVSTTEEEVVSPPQQLNNEGSETGPPPTEHDLPARQCRDSGVFLGGVEAEKEASGADSASAEIAAVDDGLSSLMEEPSTQHQQEEVGLQDLADKELASQSEEKESYIDAVLPSFQEGLPEETVEGEGEDTGKGKGKGRASADQLDADPPMLSEKLVKLAFYDCVRQVLENGMGMVGIVPLKV